MKNSANAPYGASLFGGGIVTKTFAQRSRIFPLSMLTPVLLAEDRTYRKKIAEMIGGFVDNSVCKWV
ncbi:hypothetical protein CJP72_18850 [Citrobacter sp. NCU1]|nr:hypothetical protein [Citrobacter sp. NCU1]